MMAVQDFNDVDAGGKLNMQLLLLISAREIPVEDTHVVEL